ncbi:MAG: sugar ABC transporter ATP-binding protein [Sphaerochaetaceae bacterium]|nr:sugar ABC transporter ATP-binding protein [Sphaerochaetaceae bacterium]
MKQQNILEMRNIVKQYPGVRALDGVDFTVKRGTVHCIVGENGAGKSTLIKILTCAEKMNEGTISFDGQPYTAKTIKDAMNAGISTVFQELNIVNQLTVAENLILGREEHSLGVMKSQHEYPVFAMMGEFADDISLDTRVASLSFAEKQIVEIVRSIGFQAKLVIMDEPTAALSKKESLRLYDIVTKLKEKGISIIYISHVLDDIFTVGDEVTVLRDGSVVGTKAMVETTREELVKMMVGEIVHGAYQARDIDWDHPVLEVKNLHTASLKDVSFALHKGEILGFYGLRGAGKSEVARALYGLDRWISGELIIDGQLVKVKNPEQAMHGLGLAMVPEERLTEGLFMKLSVADNIAVTNLKKFMGRFGLNEQKKQATAQHYIEELDIRAHSARQRVRTLSGGNQQKVVIAKCLHSETRILMLDEPSRGIDVGAKEEIYTIVRELAAEGSSVLVFSSEYEGVAPLCDRVVLMVKGQVAECVAQADLDAQKVHIVTMGV